jgi:hypothetical protein
MAREGRAMMRPGLLLGALASLGGAAHADEILRAAAKAPAVAVASWVCDAQGVDYAADGVHFRRVHLADRPITDIAVLDDGTLLVATEDTKDEPWVNVWVLRVAAGRRRDQLVARAPGPGGGRFKLDGNGFRLVTSEHQYEAHDSGRTFVRIEGAIGYVATPVAESLLSTPDRAENGRLRIAVSGERLLSPDRTPPDVMGVIDGDVVALAVDFRGRALVLYEGGRLVRYLRGTATVLLEGP